MLLDVSAAFDVVSHERLLGRQKEYFGITGSALNWMASYLRGRTQCVVIGSAKSYTVDVKYSFPQGSVLGGKKFIMYATPLGNIIVQHDVEHECYADDTQKYISFKLQDPGALASALEQMKQTLNVVQSWMTANILKLNSDKTEMIIFAPKRHQHLLENARIHIDDGTEEGAEKIPEVVVKNLGVMFDSTMSMTQQINSITKSCYYQLRKIKRIRKYLNEDATRSLVNAYVTSRLDQCNALLAGLPQYLIQKLQRVQNCSARLVKHIPWRASITRHLKNLHWLPVSQRIQFKVLIIVFKSLNGLAPQYLRTMFHLYRPTRVLRSSSKGLLSVKRYHTRYGFRAISRYGAVLWNKLPYDIRNLETLSQFKSCLKTHLFQTTYHI